jgi:hypothetical protein
LQGFAHEGLTRAKGSRDANSDCTQKGVGIWGGEALMARGTKPRGRVPFTEAELTAMRGGLTVEEYRWKTIRKWGRSRGN